MDASAHLSQYYTLFYLFGEHSVTAKTSARISLHNAARQCLRVCLRASLCSVWPSGDYKLFKTATCATGQQNQHLNKKARINGWHHEPFDLLDILRIVGHVELRDAVLVPTPAANLRVQCPPPEFKQAKHLAMYQRMCWNLNLFPVVVPNSLSIIFLLRSVYNFFTLSTTPLEREIKT